MCGELIGKRAPLAPLSTLSARHQAGRQGALVSLSQHIGDREFYVNQVNAINIWTDALYRRD